MKASQDANVVGEDLVGLGVVSVCCCIVKDWMAGCARPWAIYMSSHRSKAEAMTAAA